jgi:hypothetical protein
MKTKAEAVDMSAEAIATRLDEVRALYRLTVSLGKARILGPVDATRATDYRGRAPR